MNTTVMVLYLLFTSGKKKSLKICKKTKQNKNQKCPPDIFLIVNIFLSVYVDIIGSFNLIDAALIILISFFIVNIIIDTGCLVGLWDQAGLKLCNNIGADLELDPPPTF